MSQEAARAEITKKTVVYEVPGMDAVSIRHDMAYRITDAGALTMDVYSPPGTQPGARLPVVVIVAGYPDPGLQRLLGCSFKDMGSSTSWGRLLAASGLAVIAYTNLDPANDIQTLFDHIRGSAPSLGIDEHRIALWAASGNVPLALSILMARDPSIKCATLCYGLTLDLDGATWVAEGAKQFGFANPVAGKSVDDLPPDVPLFLARAGQDEFPHLNETMDRFVAQALARNLPITVANHPTGPHAFDILQDSPRTRWIIAQIQGFLRFHLLHENGR